MSPAVLVLAVLLAARAPKVNPLETRLVELRQEWEAVQAARWQHKREAVHAREQAAQQALRLDDRFADLVAQRNALKEQIAQLHAENEERATHIADLEEQCAEIFTSARQRLRDWAQKLPETFPYGIRRARARADQALAALTDPGKQEDQIDCIAYVGAANS